MASGRSQLNINIEPELLLLLKSEAIKSGKTLTQFVTEKLKDTTTEHAERLDSLENRLLKIERTLQLNINDENSGQKAVREKKIGCIFTNEGATQYGRVAKALFELHVKKKEISIDQGLKELAIFLERYEHSNPELVFQILLGTHELTGEEMTMAYRKGSCAMRTALGDWTKDSLEDLNEAFLNAVITKSLA